MAPTVDARRKSRVVKARLTDEEWDILFEAMDRRGFETISDTLREALRLLTEETRRDAGATDAYSHRKR